MFIVQTRLIRGGDRTELARFRGVVRVLDTACAAVGVTPQDVEPLIYDLRYVALMHLHGVTQHVGPEGPFDVLHLSADFWTAVPMHPTTLPVFQESFSFTLPLCKPESSPSALIDHVMRTRLAQCSLLGSFGDQRDVGRLAQARQIAGHRWLEHPEIIAFRDRAVDVDDTQSDVVVTGDLRQVGIRAVRRAASAAPRAPLLTNPETGD